MRGSEDRTAEGPSACDDTTPWVRERLVERWRSMTPIEKLRVASTHSVALQRASVAGLRLRHPDAGEAELQERAAALRVGREAYARWTGRRFDG